MTFGEDFPAVWEKDKIQEMTIISASTVITGVSSILTLNNAHDYALGMTLHVRIVSGDDINIFSKVIGKTALTVTIDYDVGNQSAVEIDFGQTIGYIAFEKSTYDNTSYIVPDVVVKTAPITRKKRVTKFGHYTNFEFTLNLLKYSDTDRINLTRLLYSINLHDVYFYPHIDKGALENKSGQKAEFNFKFFPFYQDLADFRDKATITIESNELIDLTDNIG